MAESIFHVCFIIFHKFTTSFALMNVSSGTMAVPPAYSDLGKSAKDIFSKGYGNCLHKYLLLFPLKLII